MSKFENPYAAMYVRGKQGGYTGAPWAHDAEAFKHLADQAHDIDAQRKADATDTGDAWRNIFKVLDEAAQDHMQPPEMLIDGLLPRNGTAIHGGRHEAGKGLIITDLALSVATGKDFLDKFHVNRVGSVFYLTSEGHNGIAKLRRPAWRTKRGIPDKQKIPFYLIRAVPMVMCPAEAIDALYDNIRRIDAKPAIIILDPLSSAMLGLKQDSNDDATRFDKELARPLANAFDCLVLAVAHTGKDPDKGVRGASAFPADVDAVWLQRRHPQKEEPPRVEIWNDKAKDFAPIEPFGAKGEIVYIPELGKSCPVMNWTPAEDAQELERRKVKRVVELRTEVVAALDALGACPGGANAWNEATATGGMALKDIASEILRAREKATGCAIQPTQERIDVLTATLRRDTRSGSKAKPGEGALSYLVVKRDPHIVLALRSSPETEDFDAQ